jgi:superfamily II DNA or RNA helicase
MLRRLWDLLITSVRPDRAELAPSVSFDSHTGRLFVGLDVLIRGQKVNVTGATVLSGRGNNGNRKFRLQTSRLPAVLDLFPYLREEVPGKLACRVFEIPALVNTISCLRELPHAAFSDAAAELLKSASNPAETKLVPIADFAEANKILELKFQLVDELGNRSPFDLAAIGQPIFRGNRFLRLNETSQRLGENLSKIPHNRANGAICFGGGAVPKALQLIRSHPDLEQSPSAAAVQIHQKPLEPRTYIDLENPESLIVEQNLVSEDERVIAAPSLDSSHLPEWIRVAREYYRAPTLAPSKPKRGLEVGRGRFRLQGDQIADFLTEDVSELKKTSRVLATPKVAELRIVTATPQVVTEIGFDEISKQLVVRPRYRSGQSEFDHKVFREWDRRRRYFRSGNTFHRVDWEQVDRVQKIARQAGLSERPDGSFTAPPLSIEEIINVFSQLGILTQTKVIERFRQRLQNFLTIEQVPPPAGLRENMRPREYQVAGYSWLTFLKDYGLPGILADEMGLGKTLQMLLAVAHFKERYGQCPSLVVCPAALVNKWADEATKFFRNVLTITHTGAGRFNTLRKHVSRVDLVITSYETLVRDSDLLAQRQWRFLIADEAQRIKNPATQRAKAIRNIPAEARIAITGTPVENTIRDIWAIFDFLAPGFLGRPSDFERNFVNPIERNGDKLAALDLNRRIRPFVLRRLKKQVVTELPDKIFKPIRCELTPLQRKLYQAILDRDLKLAIAAVGNQKLSLGNPHIFAVLTKLKQVCCHPGLITGDFGCYNANLSGKFDVFTELVEEALDGWRAGSKGNNKLVGFSQYVGMARALQDFLRTKHERKCSLLDGSVPPNDRHALCQAFNRDCDHFGMMMTLGAGGVGLDLQAANYVILYDRWWNPAVEDQAIDRVHRLGQEREVVVVTITTSGTLEEKIEGKLDRKRNLADQVVQADSLMRKEISREELLDLVKLEP